MRDDRDIVGASTVRQYFLDGRPIPAGYSIDYVGYAVEDMIPTPRTYLIATSPGQGCCPDCGYAMASPLCTCYLRSAS